MERVNPPKLGDGWVGCSSKLLDPFVPVDVISATGAVMIDVLTAFGHEGEETAAQAAAESQIGK